MPSAARNPRGFEAFFNRQNKSVRALLRLLTFPLFLIFALPVVVLLGGVGLYSYASLIIDAISLKIKMARAHRAVSTKILDHRIASGMSSGTFICESYTLGWPVARVWWTPDAIAISENEPIRLTGDEMIEVAAKQHQRWINDTYVDLKAGKALLFLAWAGKNIQTSLNRRFPSISFVSFWSGAVGMQRQIEMRTQGQDERQ